MDPLEKYIHSMSSPEEEILQELTRITYQRVVHPQMLSGPVQGWFLRMLVGMLQPRRILEIGTFTGYSAISMAAALTEGALLDTVEADDEGEELIKDFILRSGCGDRIRLHIGSALQVAPELGKTYDLVFIDGDKREYPAYYRMIMNMEREDTPPLVRSGSYIIADNILWYGKVADPQTNTDPHTAAIMEFNRLVREDARVENVIVPVRDGLNIIKVK